MEEASKLVSLLRLTINAAFLRLLLAQAAL